MLTHLSVRQFAIVKQLDLELRQGMTAITGETGAGKSIAIDALGLCLGERAEAGMVRPGADKAEISAAFNLQNLSKARQWLADNALELDDVNECMIRRVIFAEGRSRAFINGSAVPLQQLKALGMHLISIHGQHAHQLLLKPEQQRQQLDNFGQLQRPLNEVQQAFQQLQQLQKQAEQLQASDAQRQARRQLLEYQVTELDEFALAEDEFAQLENDYKRLSNSQSLVDNSQLSYHLLNGDDEVNVLSLLQNSLDKLLDVQDSDENLKPVTELLSEASIQLNEASQELRHYIDHLDNDPAQMQFIEQRYDGAMSLARKHQIAPEQLVEYHQQLKAEFTAIEQDDATLAQIHQQVEEARASYQQAAAALSKQRQQQANKLAAQVEKHIHQMNMAKAKFHIEVAFQEDGAPQRHGLDTVQFKVATNPGLPPDSLDKVASGGELSRIGLAVQVISSANQAIPCMIFDEVDTGISGPTASVVGGLLRRLGETAQVLCVTHLPQVAARAHNQLFVTKFTNKNSTETSMLELSNDERVKELARLLAGDELTESALANAKELLCLN